MHKIFLFGQTGSGKSTLCAAIAFLFHEHEDFAPRVDIRNDKSSLRLTREWVKSLRSGRFPDKTLRGTFLMVNIGCVNLMTMEQLGFTFMEIAGEDLRMLDPLDPNYNNRPRILDKYIEKCDTIIMVASVDPLENDRFLHQYFLEYLGQLNVVRPICLVLSEWDKLGEESAEPITFAEKNYGEAFRLLKTFGLPKVIRFSIGKVNGGGRIEDIDFSQGTNDIVNWIHNRMMDLT